ncbi:MAG: hypothetical protein J6C15_02495 [Bacteroidaceae bacterium]|nr:hypothetical protein [Bacteroidaceae bacterium]
MSYKCFTFKTTCLLGNIMQAHIALATLRGYEFPSSIIHQPQFILSTEFRRELKHDVACCTRDGTARTKNGEIVWNRVDDMTAELR